MLAVANASDSRTIPNSRVCHKMKLPTDSANDSAAATPTPAAEKVYARPQLIAPADNAALPRNEAVLLRWASVVFGVMQHGVRNGDDHGDVLS